MEHFITELTGYLDYYNNRRIKVRIRKSCKLLKQNIRVADVSAMVGYEDQSYFSKVFKKVTGKTPFQYKESHG